ncbi:MAG: glycosyltransferase [Planctomycetales bacterium]|nr:glycosyltransferase [Planctomycetales bacterium]
MARISLLRKRKQIPFLFDDGYYRDQYEDVRGVGNGWKHYCQHGFRENRNPHPLFHTAYYRRRYLDYDHDVNPVLHYIERTIPDASPHPMFDGEHYATLIGKPPSTTLLEHYLSSPLDSIKPASVFFDSQAYLSVYPDVAEHNANPLHHFLRYGVKEQRLSFLDSSQFHKLYDFEPIDWLQLAPYLRPADFVFRMIQSHKRSLADKKGTVIVVAKDASTSYESRLMRQIAARIQERGLHHVINVVGDDCKKLEQFEAVAPTVLLNGTSTEHQYVTAALQYAIRTSREFGTVGILIDAAMVNLASELSVCGAPIQIVATDSSSDTSVEEVTQRVSELVMQCDERHRLLFTCANAVESYGKHDDLHSEDWSVYSPGLIDDSVVGSASPERSACIREKYLIDDDAIVVVGCTAGDAANDSPRFLEIAESVANRYQAARVHIAWLGEVSAEQVTDAMERPLSGRITFFEANAQDAFDAANVVIWMSRQVDETLDIAMARGAAVFQPDGQAIIRTSREASNLQFCSVCDEANDAAADRIIEWLQDPVRCSKLGSDNQAFVREHLCVDDFVDKVCEGFRRNESSAGAARTLANRSKKKRVFCLSPSWEVSGVNTFAELLVRELNERDYDASILFTYNHPLNLPEERLPSVPYQFLHSTRPPNARKNERLVEFLRTMAPAVVIPNYDYRSSSIASTLPDNVQTLGILHSDDSDHYTHGYRMGNDWEQIVSVSSTIENKLLKLNPGFAHKSRTINYGVDAPDGLVNSANQDDQIEELRIVYSGRMVQQQKRILDFAELFEALEQKQVPFQVTMIGDGQEADELRKRAARFVDSGQVRMLGRLQPDEIYAELVQHHAICLMSDYEGLPLSLLEGLACGCIPVMTQIVSGVSEILTHDDNALMSPLRSPVLMAENFRRLFVDNALRKRLASTARPTLVRNHLTATQMVDRYEAVLEEMFASIESGSASKPYSNYWRCQWVDKLLDAA